MNKLKARILRTLKSLPTRGVYDPPPPPTTTTTTTKQQQQQTTGADDDADDLFFFDAPPSPDSILNPKTSPSSSPSSSSYVLEEEEEEDLLRGFEVRCPPGGEEAVIVYTTSLRGIRKTFEDCGRVRLLLRSLGAAFHERDVAMDAGYRDELRGVLGRGAAPPRVFVKGRYVGGAEELVALHDQAKLLPLLRRVAAERRGGGGGLCAGCGGAGFAVCARCSGSCKVFDEGRGVAIRCANCNENEAIPNKHLSSCLIIVFGDRIVNFEDDK
ncbi:uncharacterized protein At5g39865-like [Ananas comosus]|uniref:Uncharacterized protein At5g39865-like n=1 Tax=Ananas comosus TaxID=4615 RepID=A0A6P5FF77_ANACO|nr:uncharacterized protein At5g39865-like [Ananas comosus]